MQALPGAPGSSVESKRPTSRSLAVFARRASLLVALSLLTSAATAECAWVLWEQINTQQWSMKDGFAVALVEFARAEGLDHALGEVFRTRPEIPVVFVAGDPVEFGLVASLAHPGGNMTGLNTLSGELNAKRLELLREAFPKVSRVAVLVEPRHLSVAIRQVEAAAHSLGLQVTRLEVHSADDIERTLGTAGRRSVGALMPLSSALFHAERQRIVSLAAKHRLPAIYEHRDFADAGGLLSYGPEYSQAGCSCGC